MLDCKSTLPVCRSKRAEAYDPSWASSSRRGQTLVALIRDYPNLSEVDERLWLEEYRTQTDPSRRHKAREALSLAYGKLVLQLAAKYRRFAQDYEDLVSAGFCGLFDAIDKFDACRTDVRLGTYAAFRIRHEMQAYLRGNTRPVCLPESRAHRALARQSSRRIDAAEQACRQQGETLNSNEICRHIAAAVGLQALEVEQALQFLGGNHVPLDDDRRELPTSANLSATSHEDAVIAGLDTVALRDRIASLMEDVLGTAERRVFAARWLTDAEPARLDGLAAELNVTRERIYQLEASAKRKIGTALRLKGILPEDCTDVFGCLRVRATRRASAMAAALEPVV